MAKFKIEKVEIKSQTVSRQMVCACLTHLMCVLAIGEATKACISKRFIVKYNLAHLPDIKLRDLKKHDYG